VPVRAAEHHVRLGQQAGIDVEDAGPDDADVCARLMARAATASTSAFSLPMSAGLAPISRGRIDQQKFLHSGMSELGDDVGTGAAGADHDDSGLSDRFLTVCAPGPDLPVDMPPSWSEPTLARDRTVTDLPTIRTAALWPSRWSR
jgi:hypothetical protein